MTSVAGSKTASWRGTASRTLDDTNGNPLAKLPWGPIELAGEHLIKVSLGGKQILGCPVRAKVKPAKKTSAGASSLHSAIAEAKAPPSHLHIASAPSPSPPKQLTAGESGRFIVVARDAYGNRRDSGDDKPYPTVMPTTLPPLPGSDDDEEEVVDRSGDSMRVSDLKDGSYSVSFSRCKAGEYRAQAYLTGVAVRGMLTFRVVAGPIHLVSCSASGENIHEGLAGQTSSFSIFARDRVGNLRVNGGHEWRVVIEPRGDDEASDLKAAAEEATASAAITDAKDGRYHVGFVVPRAGRYFVHVTLLEKKREGGEASEEQEEPRQQYPLPGSPFAHSVLPSSDDPSCVTLEAKSGLELAREDQPAIVDAGQAMEVVMRVVGLERAIDAAAEAAILARLRVHISRTGDGKHTSRTTEEESPRSGMSAVAGARILSCESEAGRLRVRFYAFDASHGGGYALNVALAGRALPSSPVKFMIRPTDTDPSKCRLSAAVPPRNAWMASFDAPNSPNSIIGPADQPLVVLTADGSLITKGELEVPAGSPAVLWLQACDSYGNKRSGGGDMFSVQLVRAPGGEQPLAIESSAPVGLEENMEVSDREDGTYTATFIRERSGDYTARAWLDGTPLPGRVLCRVLPGPISPDHCGVLGGKLPTAVSGAKNSFELRAHDQFGNLLGAGGVVWDIKVTPAAGPIPTSAAIAAAESAEASMEIKDHGDGRYTISCVLTTPGHFAVQIGVAGRAPAGEQVAADPVLGSPFALDVAPSLAQAAHWHIVGDGWRDAIAGEPTIVRIASTPNAQLPQTNKPVRFRAAVELLNASGGEPRLVDVPVKFLHGAWAAAAALHRSVSAHSLTRRSSPASSDMASESEEHELSFVAPLASEDYRLHVWLQEPDAELGEAAVEEEPIAGSPFSFGVRPSIVNAAKCELQMRDAKTKLESGSRGVLRLLLRDAHGNVVNGAAAALLTAARVVLLPAAKVDANGEVVSPSEQPSVTCTLSLDKSDPASLLATFVLARSGEYAAHAWISNKQVPKMLCRVHPGSVCVSACALEGAGVLRAVSGVRGGFEIDARDAYGNTVGVGGLSWRVNILLLAGEEPHPNAYEAATRDGPVSVHDRGNGFYHVAYTLSTAGQYRVIVALAPDEDEEEVDGEEDDAAALRRSMQLPEARLTVEPAPISAVACAASLPSRVAAGAYGIVLVHAKDAAGNALPAASLRDGLRARFSSDEVSDESGLEVLLHEAAQKAADDPLSEMPKDCVSTKGSALVAVRALRAGRYSLLLTAHGVLIRGAPFVVDVIPAVTHPASTVLAFRAAAPPPKAAASNVTADLGAPPSQPAPRPQMPQPALPPLSTHLTMTAGADVHAVVTLKDRHGNTRASGGEVVRLLMSSPKRVSLAEVTDEKDGSYTCAFEAIDAGDVQAFLSVNGHAVEIKAPPLLVLPASPDALTLTTHRLQHKFWPAPNLGGEAIAAPLGEVIELNVSATDIHGNQCELLPSAVEASVVSEAETSVDALAATPSEEGERVLRLAWKPSAVGAVRFEVAARADLGGTARFQVVDARGEGVDSVAGE